MSEDGITAHARALDAAQRAWGTAWQPSIMTRAPGRLELLGNHVDYNGGPVLAAAIDRDTTCLVQPSRQPGLRVLLADVSNTPVSIYPDELTGWQNDKNEPAPFDYVRGVVATGLARGLEFSDGLHIAVAGDVPIGLGLSSSASLCVALTLALHTPAPRGRDLVLRAQEAEHRAGTPCGTMDQAASVGGNVILYDGSTASWTEIAPDLGDCVFAVADSGVSRSLATSSYPRRVEESQRALSSINALIATTFPSLASVDISHLHDIERAPQRVLSDVLKKRVRHVLTEVARVREGHAAMQNGDWARFGALMTESGRSSANDYEISHPRVEALVEVARSIPGVFGARMMGGGEGGIALVLLPVDIVPVLAETLDKQYYARYPVHNSNPVKVFRFSSGAGRFQYP